MDRIDAVLAAVRRRLWANLTLDTLARLLVPAMTLTAACVGAQRLLALDLPRGAPLLPIALALLLAPILARFRLPDMNSLAAVIDQRLALKDTLSTALHARSRNAGDAFTAQLLQRARTVAASITPAQAMPCSLTRAWRGAAVAVALTTLWLMFLPHADPLGRAARRQQTAQRRAADNNAREQIVRVSQTVEKLQQNNPELADPEAAQAAKLADEIARQPLDTDEQRRDAQAKLSAVEERLASAADRREQAFRGMETAFSSLESKSPGPADRFTDALRRGDYETAQKEIGDLGKNADHMPPQQREELKKQLASLSEQLAQASREQEQARERLRKERDAQNKDAVRDPSRDKPGIGDADQRSDDLDQRARAADETAQNASRLSKSLDHMAKSLDPATQPAPADRRPEKPRPDQHNNTPPKPPVTQPGNPSKNNDSTPGVTTSPQKQGEQNNQPTPDQPGRSSTPHDASESQREGTRATPQEKPDRPDPKPQDTSFDKQPSPNSEHHNADGQPDNPPQERRTTDGGKPGDEKAIAPQKRDASPKGMKQQGEQRPGDTKPGGDSQRPADRRVADGRKPDGENSGGDQMRENQPNGPQQQPDRATRDEKPGGEQRPGEEDSGDDRKSGGSQQQTKHAEGGTKSQGEKQSNEQQHGGQPQRSADQRVADGQQSDGDKKTGKQPGDANQRSEGKQDGAKSQEDQRSADGRQRAAPRDAAGEVSDELSQLSRMQEQVRQLRQAQSQTREAMRELGPDGGKQNGPQNQEPRQPGVAGGSQEPGKDPAVPGDKPSPGGGLGGSLAGSDGDGKPIGTPTRVDAFKPSPELDSSEGQGRVIARWLENGPMKRGEAKQAYDSALRDARRDAEQAVIDDRVPRQYHDTILKYFDQAPASPEKVAPPSK